MANNFTTSKLILTSQEVTASGNTLLVNGQPISATGFATTGWVDAGYYPRNNPSGYITGVVTGNFVTTAQTGILATTGWVNQLYYPRTNPSGYLTGVNTGNFVTTNQTGSFVVSGLFGGLEMHSGNFPTGNSDTLWVSFAHIFTIAPMVMVQMHRKSNIPILTCDVTGVVTTGFWLNLTDSPDSGSYYYVYTASTGVGIF